MGNYRGCLYLVVASPQSVETATSYLQEDSFEPSVRFGFYVSFINEVALYFELPTNRYGSK